MGRSYPDHYVGHYPHLAKWLVQQGHIVYNYEMFCDAVPVNHGEPYQVPEYSYPAFNTGKRIVARKAYEVQPRRWLYGAVDVVSWHGTQLWAWEYKSLNDKLAVGAVQCWNYSRSFDVVCLACVKVPKGETLEILRFIGAGIYQQTQDGFECLLQPRTQQPDAKLREQLVARFRRNALGKPTAAAAALAGSAGRQLQL